MVVKSTIHAISSDLAFEMNHPEGKPEIRESRSHTHQAIITFKQSNNQIARQNPGANADIVTPMHAKPTHTSQESQETVPEINRNTCPDFMNRIQTSLGLIENGLSSRITTAQTPIDSRLDLVHALQKDMGGSRVW